MGSSHPNYPRLSGNQGWTKEMDNARRDWRDRGGEFCVAYAKALPKKRKDVIGSPYIRLKSGYGERLDNFVDRVEEREHCEDSFVGLSELRSDITALRVYMDQLRSTDISMLWGQVPLPEMLALVSSTKLKRDGPTTEFVRDDEQVSVEALAELQSLEESIVHATLERSHMETSMIDTSGICPSDSTILPHDVSGTNAPVDATLLLHNLDMQGKVQDERKGESLKCSRFYRALRIVAKN
ncbi:hypothetical protein MTR67_047794 [Solanum verrucosum]|uniref:Uncharacterized protein n=1 Tax=Solanum verrucosum TaxID=315347 RepID=A0AAF0ZZD8_SOLVR|nr:hypothetical protein MTR67_047794 [Solanum verrucosum]